MTGPVVPAVQLLGDAVLFRGPAIRDLAYLLPRAVADVTRRDSIPVSPRWRLILEAVNTAMSACPVTDVRVESKRSEWVTTAEAATALGITERHARRIARQLGGHLGRGGWLIPSSSIEQRRTT